MYTRNILSSVATLCLLFICTSCVPEKSISLGPLPLDKIWTFDTGEQIVSPVYIDDAIMFAQTESQLFAVDIYNQELRWKIDIPTDKLHTVNLISSDKVLIANGKNGLIMALNTKTGEILWKNQIDVAPTPIFNAWVEDIEIYNETVYVARYSTFLTAYDLHSGEVLWSVRAPNRSNLTILPNEASIYLVSITSLMQFDTESGKMLQQNTIGTKIHSAVMEGDTFYFSIGTDKGISIFALDSKTLDQKWIIKPEGLSLSEFTGIAIEGDVLYVSGDRIVAVEVDEGQIIWSGEIKSHYGPPVVSGDNVYIQDRTNLYAYEKMQGVPLGRLSVISDIPWNFRPHVNPTVIGNLLIIPSKTGHIDGYEIYNNKDVNSKVP